MIHRYYWRPLCHWWRINLSLSSIKMMHDNHIIKMLIDLDNSGWCDYLICIICITLLIHISTPYIRTCELCDVHLMMTNKFDVSRSHVFYPGVPRAWHSVNGIFIMNTFRFCPGLCWNTLRPEMNKNELKRKIWKHKTMTFIEVCMEYFVGKLLQLPTNRAWHVASH